VLERSKGDQDVRSVRSVSHCLSYGVVRLERVAERGVKRTKKKPNGPSTAKNQDPQGGTGKYGGGSGFQGKGPILKQEWGRGLLPRPRFTGC